MLDAPTDQDLPDDVEALRALLIERNTELSALRNRPLCTVWRSVERARRMVST